MDVGLPIRVVFLFGGLSSWWPFVRVVFHQGGLSSGIPLCHSVVQRKRHSTEQQYNTKQCKTIQYNTKQYSTIQNNTVQYKAIQYNTKQYNRVEYNTVKIYCPRGEIEWAAATTQLDIKLHVYTVHQSCAKTP